MLNHGRFDADARGSISQRGTLAYGDEQAEFI